jgi:hypothetical protein
VAIAAAFGALASTTFGSSAAPPPISIDITIAMPAEATDSSGADVSYHVKSHLDLVVTCTPTGTGTDFTASTHFAIGPPDPTISCSDSNANTQEVTVQVRDTTPPTVLVPPGAGGSTTDPSGTATVTWPSVTASDLVDGTIAATCDHSSGDAFPVGNTTVTCQATDSHGNTGSGSFTVTVTFLDTTAPTFGAHPDITAEATSAAGAVVSYSVTATDDSGVPPTVNCAPSSGSTFALGATTVTCTATDAANNSANAAFTVTMQDTTPPNLNLPSNISVEAESASGKTVTYTASATDAVSGALPATCDPASGSTFPMGTTTVNCSATDGAGKAASGSFTVTVTDSSGPAFSGVPGDRQVEANGPAGSIVNYPVPSASDATDGPELVACNPPSGSTFPLGTSTVTCRASDSHGSVSTVSFAVRVVDTTKPTLIVPADFAVYADTPDGISAQSHYPAEWLAQAHVVDLVDPNPQVFNDAPDFFAVGEHGVTFRAVDASGNSVSKVATLHVRPMPPAGTPPLPVPPARKPPANVTNLKAEAGDRQVRLSWQIPAGVDHVVVNRALTAGGDAQLVYTGKATSFRDRGVANGLEYRYTVVSVDRSGTESAGVAVVAVPKRNLLRSPKDGARLKKPPKLAWVKNPEASYYNVQLFRGQVKILSIWPVAASAAVKRTWKYQGTRYTLTKGVYRWYVWPGFGARSAIDYGELMGSSSFEMIR